MDNHEILNVLCWLAASGALFVAGLNLIPTQTERLIRDRDRRADEANRSATFYLRMAHIRPEERGGSYVWDESKSRRILALDGTALPGSFRLGAIRERLLSDLDTLKVLTLSVDAQLIAEGYIDLSKYAYVKRTIAECIDETRDRLEGLESPYSIHGLRRQVKSYRIRRRIAKERVLLTLNR